MLPFNSKRSSTRDISNLSYFASLTPIAKFSKSQKTAIVCVRSGAVAMKQILHGAARIATGSGAEYARLNASTENSIQITRLSTNQSWPRSLSRNTL
jgi:hypothetical protein